MEILSPAELLQKLHSYLLSENKERCLEFFRKHSQQNQYQTFLNMMERFTISAYFLDEYIVVFAVSQEHGTQLFVIGLDDNYNFFCHNLPEESVANLNPDNLSVESIKNEMGFDYHLWEVAELKQLPRARIRLQGDIVITIEKIFKNDGELYLYMYKTALENFLNTYWSRLSPLLVSVIRTKLKQIENMNTDVEEFLKMIHDSLLDLSPLALARILGEIKSILPLYISRVPTQKYGWSAKYYYVDEIVRIIDAYIRDTIKEMCDLENILNIQIGNHRIKVIGINEWDLMDIFRNNNRPIRDRIRIFVLRPHLVSAVHDEHKSVSLSIPRCIISVSTLRTGRFQVLRHQRITLTADRHLRFKIVVIDLCNVNPRRILHNDFIQVSRGYLNLFGTEFFVCRDIANVNSLSVLYELLIWYMRPGLIDNEVRNLYYHGSRICVIIVDTSNRDIMRELPKYIEEFWKNSGGTWPIVILGYRRNRKRDALISLDSLQKYADRLSEHTLVRSMFVEFNGKRRALRDSITECVENMIKIILRRAHVSS
ncbi:MAG: hypothetical protein Q6363_008280 [Candidatus Njordarchaeota archaeon]